MSQLVSVIIPVYKTTDTLIQLCARIKGALQDYCAYEIILVDDNSSEESWPTIRGICKKERLVRGVKLLKNYGQHNALACGISRSKGDIIATLDDDLQHPPECLPELIAELGSTFDVVYGKPQERSTTLIRQLISKATKNVLSILARDENIAVNASALRVFQGRLRVLFNSHANPSTNVDVVLSWGASNYCIRPVNFNFRAQGDSGYSLKRLARHATNILTGMTTTPLRLASILGVTMFAFGLLLIIYLVSIGIAYGTPVPGFMFIATTICLFNGAQMLAIGIIGEYLARVYLRASDRPCFIVREELNAT